MHIALMTVSLLSSFSAVAYSGVIQVKPQSNRKNTLSLNITGDAAIAIENQLLANGIRYKSYPEYSKSLFLFGDKIECYKTSDAAQDLYCHISIEASAVVKYNPLPSTLLEKH